MFPSILLGATWIFSALLTVSASNLTAGVFFMHTLSIADYASKLSHTEVKFTASTKGSPDLPKWLRLEQDSPSQSAFIYGTPSKTSAHKLDLEITGWDKDDYSVKRKEITIYIDHSKGDLRYQAEFTVVNFNLDEFLAKNQPVTFKNKVEELWKSPPRGVQVTGVESLVDRGGRVPIPPKKEGVFIAVGGEREYATLKEDYLGCKGLKDGAKNIFNPTGYWKIDWCKLRLRDALAVTPTPNTTGGPVVAAFDGSFDSTAYSPPEHAPVARDFGALFVLVIILPLIIVLIIAIFLGCIMFCFRQGRYTRDRQTPRSQINHHDSILRTTFQLRQMSHENGDVTHPSTPASSRAGQDRPDRATTPTTPNHPDERPSHSSTPYARSRQGSQASSEPESPSRGAPPPYRMPPASGVNVTHPDGSNQYYPGGQSPRHPSSQASTPPRQHRAPPFMDSSDFDKH